MLRQKPGAIPGSPPRVRGKVIVRRSDGRAGGITPARAGKRTVKRNRREADRDHPRACGEKETKIDLDKLMAGSPPRVRGKGLHSEK